MSKNTQFQKIPKESHSQKAERLNKAIHDAMIDRISEYLDGHNILKIFNEIIYDPTLLDATINFGGIVCKISEVIQIKISALPEEKLTRIKSKIDTLPKEYVKQKVMLHELCPKRTSDDSGIEEPTSTQLPTSQEDPDAEPIAWVAERYRPTPPKIKRTSSIVEIQIQQTEESKQASRELLKSTTLLELNDIDDDGITPYQDAILLLSGADIIFPEEET